MVAVSPEMGLALGIQQNFHVYFKMENSRFFSDMKCGYYICGDANKHKVYAVGRKTKYTVIPIVCKDALGLALHAVKMVKSKK